MQTTETARPGSNDSDRSRYRQFHGPRSPFGPTARRWGWSRKDPFPRQKSASALDL